jgi:hypothetical protein
MDLPFPAGQAWLVSHGVGKQGGPHRGFACFCWGFVRADEPVGVVARVGLHTTWSGVR